VSSYSDVCAVIEEDLGASPNELFESFEKEPIASASLAQVHVAYDKETGEKLAVKVQHRGLRETSKGDVFAISTVINVLDSLFEDFTWMWIAEEIAPQVCWIVSVDEMTFLKRCANDVYIRATTISFPKSWTFAMKGGIQKRQRKQLRKLV